jgi:gamma-glutamyl-gamma-aminobutyrate hydrolase PuuD
MMKIGIVPAIIDRFNRTEICVDTKLLKFLNKLFPKSSIQILLKKENVKLNLIILSGGNNIINFSKKKTDILRSSFDNYFFKKAIKKNILILGICHGAQFIAKKFNSIIIKKKHIGSHKIFLTNKKYSKTVNSYHNFIITKSGPKLKVLAKAHDKSIESFMYKKKVLGILWHPERYRKIKNFDIKFIKKNLCN